MGTVKVSAIMPTANRAMFINMAVGSCLAQDYPDFELVILDSGESIEHLLPANRRIRYFRSEGNTGQLRNKACELATGDIVIHFDSDDWSAPERMRRQVERLQSSRKQLTGYNALLFWDGRQGYARCDGLRFTFGASQCYYRSWWNKHRFPEKRTGEDTEFSTAARSLNQLDVMDGGEMLVALVHAGNTSPKDVRSRIYRPIGRELMPPKFLAAVGVSSLWP